MVGDSAYDTLDWHDHLLAAEVVAVAPYNARNADDPKDIEYRGRRPHRSAQRGRSAEAVHVGGDVQPPYRS